MVTKSEKKIYEVSFHLVPTIDADALSGVFERIKAIVSGQGEIVSEEQPVRRGLAYTIRHTVRQSDGSYNRYDEAYFGSVKFRALRGGVKQIEASLNSDDEVLRFLLLETVAEDTRIGEILPGTEEEERGADEQGGGSSADEQKGDSNTDEQESGESGIAEQPDEGGGKSA